MLGRTAVRSTVFSAFCVGVVLTANAVGQVTPAADSVSRRLDAALAQTWMAEAVTPQPVCTDAEFLRRVWLDLAGRTPPYVEAVKIADAKSRLDRTALADKLLASPEFASHWARLWTEYLTDRRPFDQNEYDGRKLLQFLRESFAINEPYDQLVAALISGEGTSDLSGPANFLLRFGVDPGPLAGAVSQKFLGLSLQCAECHDHPHAAWKQRDFWGLAAHFARLRRMTPSNPQNGENFFVVIERPRGELLVVDQKAPADEQGNRPTRTVFPQLPGQPRPNPSLTARRDALLQWITAAENPYFARHAVNQVWLRLMGARLVEGFDRWPEGAADASVAVLDLLRDDFVAHGFDLRNLIRTIVLSDAYQRSNRVAYSPNERLGTASSPPPAPRDAGGGEDAVPSHSAAKQVAQQQTLWARGRIRPLSADQIHLSLAQAFGSHYDENDFRLAELTGEEFTYDLPTQTFGETPLSLRSSIALYQSEHIRGIVEFAAEALVRLYGEGVSPNHIERMYLALLSRRPTETELDQMLDLAASDQPKAGLEDAVWVLLNSAEFVTNH